MQSEHKEKQEKAKGKLQSAIQCTLAKNISDTTSYNFLAV